MNLFFRLLYLMIVTRSWRLIPATAPLDLKFYITPFDCDLNGHMTNSRYFALMDLGRFIMMKATPLWSKMVKDFWFPLVGSVEMTFIREIKPFHTVILKTRLIDYDKKYIYLQQDFFVGEKLCATGRVKGLFSSSAGLIATAEVLDLLGLSFDENKSLVQSLSIWNNYLEHKKDETT